MNGSVLLDGDGHEDVWRHGARQERHPPGDAEAQDVHRVSEGELRQHLQLLKRGRAPSATSAAQAEVQVEADSSSKNVFANKKEVDSHK